MKGPYGFELDFDYVGISDCGQWISTVSDRTVSLWDCASKDNQASREIQASNSYVLVQDISACIESIAWRLKALEFVVGCGDGSVYMWRLHKESQGRMVQLVFGLSLNELHFLQTAKC